MNGVAAGGGMHLVLAADGRYAMPLAAAVASAARRTDARRGIVFHLLHSAFPAALRRKVERSLQGAGRPLARIEWIPLEMGRLAGLRLVHDYMSPLIYARLLIPDLLPADVGRALYLDADMVVLEDLASLWDTDLGGRSVGAVRDRIGHVGAPGGLVNHAALGIPADAPYFNSGLLLMDLARWRALGIGRRVVEYLETHRDLIQMGDQDGLNALLHHDWHELPFRWNWQTLPRMHRQGPPTCWSPASAHQSIVHFSSSEKPWLPGCELADRRFFFEAVDRTAWAGWRVPAWREAWVRIKRALRGGQRRLQGALAPGRRAA
ncbi:glycosyltransferase family 8 protein [Aquincola sp. MAHUQ-54]|uniref:Glycosyltransferase family 8 protein n=1 Tax=Aquincola agrisoli TaxID=3119538 RepID=A0AAW9QBV7_9BURK